MSALGFLKAHRLSSKKHIETIFTKGNSCNEFPFRFIWLTDNESECNFTIAISVPKKRIALAVDRNLIKRRIRESVRKFYTQNNSLFPSNTSLAIVIVYSHTSSYTQHETDIKISKGLHKILEHVQNN